MDDRQGGGNGRPPREKTMRTPHPFEHSMNSTPHWPEGAIALDREAPLHAPCGIRGGGVHVSHPTHTIPGGGGWTGPGLSGILLVNCRLTGHRDAYSGLAHAPGRNVPSRSHLSGVM